MSLTNAVRPYFLNRLAKELNHAIYRSHETFAQLTTSARVVMYRSHHNLRAFFAPSSQGDLVVRRRRADDTSYYIDRGLAYRIEMPDDGLRSKYNL